MTTPTLIYRVLTVHFARSVTFPDQIPLNMEVVVTPLVTSSTVTSGATFIEGPASQSVLLSDIDNSVSFSLVPTDLPGLSDRVLYRIAWRAGGATGRTFVYDFAMPDEDVTFEEIGTLGNIIDGEAYLQITDLGVPGRVARLNENGQVVDANGIPLPGQVDLIAVESGLALEIVDRQAADAAIFDELSSDIDMQFNQAITTSQTNLIDAQTVINASITNEINARSAADATESGLRAGGDTNLQNQINTHTTSLAAKADLVAGKVPVTQIPDAALSSAVQVADQAAMLALTTSQVQPGDLAVRPDGTYLLTGTDPSVLGNWLNLSTVISVNGESGAVILDLTDVAAAGGAIPQSQVTGLVTALVAKANLVGGEIPRAEHGSDLAYVDGLDRITKKDGTVLAGGTTSVNSVNGETGTVVLDLTEVAAAGGEVPQAQITGLATTLSGKVDDTDPRLTDARTPTAHASTHGSGQSDPITIAQSQVTGLSAIISNNGLTGSSNHETRIATLEVGGGGAGSVAKANWYDGTGDFTGVTDPADFQDVHSVLLKGPWSKDGSGDYSYNAAGVAPGGESYVWAYITPNGHLELREWDESNPADPALALQTDLDAAEASIASLGSTKADQSALNTTNATVATKANQSALDTTNATVAANTAALAAKADLVGGIVPVAQVPDLAQSKITGLSTSLAAKADLSGGVVTLSQIPSGIATSKISGLDAALAAKADLSGGKLSTAQVPDTALNTVTEVANQAAMLAQSSSVVQPGDVTVITSTSAKGTYMLKATDPALLSNWVLLQPPLDSVLTVNGQTGTVVLDAAAVGAISAGSSLAISQVLGLQSSLDSKASVIYVDGQLTTKTSITDVQNIMTASVHAKQKVDYVSTSSIASLSGQQSADGVLMALGSKVLVTAQSSSVLNGIYQVNSSAWTRVADMASGSFLVKGTVVVVGSGTTNANTLWQSTSTSGLVDTASNNWAKIGNVAPPYTPIQGNGISITGTAPNQTFAAVAASGGGCSVSSSGIGIDTAVVARKFVGTVPSGSTTPTITHNLGTNRVMVQVIEIASGIGVLVGWQATSSNAVQLEFSSAPAAGQWSCLVIG